MNIKHLYREFEELAEQLNIKLVTSKGNFNGDYCLVEKDKYIVVNKNKPIEYRIRRLASAFSFLDLSNIYIKPAIRELIESERKGSLF
ncbi:MAG: hypothetical protein HQ510_11660 [Candidatus Marinimicrobia bacterium]|nr:hypothetical protein [Candidatus Neomarinimicrobiota bacterium]